MYVWIYTVQVVKEWSRLNFTDISWVSWGPQESCEDLSAFPVSLPIDTSIWIIFYGKYLHKHIPIQRVFFHVKMSYQTFVYRESYDSTN